MHPLLSRYISKLGFKNIEELSDKPMPDGSPSEKQTLESWNRILSKNEAVTVENVAEFCRQQIKAIEGRWKDLDNARKKNDRLVLLHTVYSAILESISAPQQQREALELYLKGLLDSK